MELIVVKSFTNYFSANILLTRLKSEGIECYLKDEYTVTVDPLLSNAVGGIKLMIHKADAHKVLGLLDEYDASYKMQSLCPNCGSHDINLLFLPTSANVLRALVKRFLKQDPYKPECVYRCSSCGKESNHLSQAYNLPEITPENLN